MENLNRIFLLVPLSWHVELLWIKHRMEQGQFHENYCGFIFLTGFRFSLDEFAQRGKTSIDNIYTDYLHTTRRANPRKLLGQRANMSWNEGPNVMDINFADPSLFRFLGKSLDTLSSAHDTRVNYVPNPGPLRI